MTKQDIVNEISQKIEIENNAVTKVIESLMDPWEKGEEFNTISDVLVNWGRLYIFGKLTRFNFS